MEIAKCLLCGCIFDRCETNDQCPECGNSDRRNFVSDKMLDAFLRVMKKRGVYAETENFIRAGNVDDAVNMIRLISLDSNEPFENELIEKIKKNIELNPNTPAVSAHSNIRRDEIITHNKNASLTTCPICNGKLSTRATACPHCGNPTGVHTCPKCGSTNTKTISGASKAASIYLWGPFAANKVVSKFQCKDCWHKW